MAGKSSVVERRAIAAALRTFSHEHREVIQNNITLGDIDAFSCLLGQFRSKAHRLQSPRLIRYQTLIYLELAAIGSLSVAASEVGGETKILQPDFPAKDIHLAGSLTNIVNTALAILRLALDGLDTQARVLVRTLNERIFQVLLLYSSAADFEEWQKAQDQLDTKQAWYQLFSRKRRLRRRLRELERALDFDLGDAHETWRDGADADYSAAVHGGSVPVQVGSWAFDYDTGHLTPALYGRASAAAKPTLAHTRWQLFYFILLFSRVLERVHHWKPQLSDPMIAYHVGFRQALIASAHHWVDEWTHDQK